MCSMATCGDASTGQTSSRSPGNTRAVRVLACPWKIRFCLLIGEAPGRQVDFDALAAPDVDLSKVTRIDDLRFLVRRFEHESGVHAGDPDNLVSLTRALARTLLMIRDRDKEIRSLKRGRDPGIDDVKRALGCLPGEDRTSKQDAEMPTDAATNDDRLERALRIADVALAFGEVERATMHPDGRPESDSTHTVMLGLMGIELADEDLDPGLVAIYTLIHDLPEFSAGDTCTAWGLTEDQAQAKAAREAKAVERLEELGLHRIVALIRRYEAQADPESRWVRLADKITPSLTHLRNGARALAAVGMTSETMRERHAAHVDELARQYPERGPIFDMLSAAFARCEDELSKALDEGVWTDEHE